MSAAPASAQVDLAALKRRHLLGDVVEAAGVALRGRGRVRQAVCPFHQEQEGSFTVYADSERWYCFGCGEGGDVLDFLQRLEGLSLPEAIRRLEAAPAPPIRATPSSRPAPPPAGPARDPALLTAAVRHYADELRGSREARAYLASRGIPAGAAVRLGLGYASGRGLRRSLEGRGFSRERLQNSGLFTGAGARFAGMVVVPEIAGGRVRWLAGRAIDPQRSPRFQALPGPKPVLGLGQLGAAPPWAVVTEGLFDWLVLARWGLPACAALGTQGLERIVQALRGCPRVFIAFDSDEAGREATERLAGLLGRRAACLSLPPGIVDVAELAASAHGRTVFEHLLTRAARAAV
ncbi:MAG: CHC2 zinc finger domain-containing protein [Chloroflexi bacterium]|nr:CHC2 zinc finger domain-containing protein [Chloroflexota bacterium]